jgi:hypothetical protein
MDKEKVTQAMHEAVQTTFMDMAFLDILPMEEEPEEITYNQVIHISFSEPEYGDVTLYLPLECKKMIVENIHGEDWEAVSSDSIDDCLLELLNVLAGNFLNSYSGKEVSHNMSFPEMLFDEEDFHKKGDHVDLYYDAEGVPFRITVYVR